MNSLITICCPIGTTGRKKVNMKYYVYYRKKNHLKGTIYERNVSNLIRVKMDIENIYRWQDVGNLLNDVVEWRIYDEKTNLIEIGVVVETEVKSKDIIWFKKEER